MELLGLVFLLSAVFSEDRNNMTGYDDIISRADNDSAGSGGELVTTTEDSNGTDDYDEDDSFLDKIAGGEFASPGEIPWQANLKSLHISSGRLRFGIICGAVIINEFWLLSAAHCFRKTVSKNWQVSVGDYELDKVDPDEQLFSADKILEHRKYNPNTSDYDIALIKIKPVNGSGIVYSDNVQPIYLPRVDTEIVNNTRVLVSGWGVISRPTNETRLSPNKLKKSILPIVDLATCRKLYRSVITKRMFCTGIGALGSGDSGGPAAHRTREGYYELYGIASWTSSNYNLRTPDGFTFVPAFLGWINAMVDGYSDDVSQVFLRVPPANQTRISNVVHTAI